MTAAAAASAASSIRRHGRSARGSGNGGGGGGGGPQHIVCSKSLRNANRRRLEDNLAVIFMGIVVFFLVSHFPRIFLGLHELIYPPRPEICLHAGKKSIALWAHIFADFSHLLLVLNSCVNSLIYCGLSSRFRNQVLMHARRVGDWIGARIPPPVRRLWAARPKLFGGSGRGGGADLEMSPGSGGRAAGINFVSTSPNGLKTWGAIAEENDGATERLCQPAAGEAEEKGVLMRPADAGENAEDASKGVGHNGVTKTTRV